MATYLKRKNDFVWKKIDDQIIVLDIEKSLIYELNDTAGFIWSITSKYISLEYIIDSIVIHYSISPIIAKKNVIDFIEKNKLLFDFKN